jgi:hypothetical protein
VRAVGLVLAAQSRRQWRSWLALSVLIALVSGFVLAASAAGRRTGSAFPRFVADHGYDAVVYPSGPVPGLARFPGVDSVTAARVLVAGFPSCACTTPIGSSDFAVLEVPPAGLTRMVKLVAGRLPDQSAPGEVLASFTLAQDKGVRVGSVIRVPAYARSQQAALSSGGPPGPPAGPRLALRVVGIEAAENEFPSGQMPLYDLYTTRAFAAEENPRAVTGDVYYVRLRQGRSGLPGFDARLRRFHAISVHLDGTAAAVAASIRPQALGWLVLAGLAALAGLAVIGQAIARQSVTGASEYPTLAALGMRSRELAVLGLLRVLAAAVAGAAGGVALATALSPLAPVGEARLAEPSAGLSFDPLILLLGALATVLAVLALGVRPAIRSAQVVHAGDRPPDSSPSRTVRLATAAGAPPSAVIGIGRALGRGRGSYPLPVATALAGTIMAVGALCATAVFGASLSHLVASPELYGDPFQAWFTESAGPHDAQILRGSLLRSLTNDPSIDRVTLAAAPEIAVNHADVRAIAVTAVRGRTLLSDAGGRLPHGDGEITLGATTMRAARVQVGSVVRVTVTGPAGATRTAPFRGVGQTSFPSDFGTGGLGTGAALTVHAYLDALCPPGAAQAGCRRAAGQGIEYALLAHAVPGPAGSAALTRYIRRYPSLAARPAVPTALVNFGVSVDFPLILSVMLALFGAATLVHLLAVSVARRRREAGVLKVLGFVRLQVSTVVCWQATTVALIGVAAGIPLGMAAGQAAWRLFAAGLGVVPVPLVPVWLLAGLAAGVLAAANVLAVSPALIAARTRPAELLRTQ